MTDTPMTSAEALMAAHQIENCLPHHKEQLPATLRAYADLLDHKVPDRLSEAVFDAIYDHEKPTSDVPLSSALDVSAATDAILALIPPAIRDAAELYRAIIGSDGEQSSE